MNFRDLDYFAVVARLRHVGRAAQALGLGQPAISMSLRRLERSLQSKLVVRTAKGVELTDVGSALFRAMRRLELARADVLGEVEDVAKGRTGHIRLGVGPGLPDDIAAVAAARLLSESPSVTLRVSVISSDTVLSALVEGELDLAISTGPSTAVRELHYVPLIEDEFVVYASRQHELSRRKRLALGDFVGQRWAKSIASRFPWEALTRAFEAGGLPRPQVGVESDSTTFRLHCVARSRLLGLISRPFLSKAASQHGLTELRSRDLRFPRSVGVSHRADGYLSPAARRMVELLAAASTDGP